MNRAERDFGAVSDMFDSLVKQVSQLLPDFGTHQGFDGKALKSAFNRQRDSRQGQDLGPGRPLGQARVSLHRSERPAAQESKKMVWLQDPFTR